MDYKNIAVLGSNSFAGSNFINRALTDGYTVLGFNRSKENKSFLLPYQNSKTKNYKFIQLDINKDVERLIYNLDLFKPNIVVDF